MAKAETSAPHAIQMTSKGGKRKEMFLVIQCIADESNRSVADVTERLLMTAPIVVESLQAMKSGSKVEWCEAGLDLFCPDWRERALARERHASKRKQKRAN